MAPTVVRFGGFEIDRRSGELLKGGRRLHLAPQAFQLLDLLVLAGGKVITRHEIRRALWSDDTFVDFDAAVNVCISQIRFALGDKAAAPRFVETLPRRGYRFVAPVIHAGSEPIAEPSSTPDTPPAIHSQPHGHTRRAGLMLIWLTAAAAGVLTIGAAYAVSGTAVERVATAQSIEALQKFERGRSGLADAAPAELVERVKHLTTAVTLEPGLAEAYVAMADAYLLIAAYRAQEPQLAYAAAKAAAAKALHLDPRDGTAHATYAAALLFFDWDWAGARRHFRRAVSLSPDSPRVQHWYARYLTALGRHHDAIRHARRSLELSPASPSAETYMGVAAFYVGDLSGARQHCERALALMPEFEPARTCLTAASDPSGAAPALPEAYLKLTLSLTRAGDRTQALKRLQTAANRHADSLVLLAAQPALRALADESQFQNILQRVGPH
jgi:DNA-binding winged helix-turn-helix (wHTH) protein/tetratricopeptide (TPR) repeat protein